FSNPVVFTVVGGSTRLRLIDPFQQVRSMCGEGESDRVGQALPRQPGREVRGAAGAIGADQDFLRPSAVLTEQGRWELGESLPGDADVIGGGVRAGVAGPELDRQRFPGPFAAVIQERAQRVVAEAAFERWCGLLLLAVDIDQGGVEVDDPRILRT